MFISVTNCMKNRIFFNFFIGFSTIGLLILWYFTHLYMIESVPRGLHIDEVGMAYDAFCIANWGVDRTLISYPLYSVNTAGASSVLYLYMCAFFMKLFHPMTDTWIIRLPAVIMSVLMMISIVIIVKKIYSIFWGILAGYLYCIFPYFIMQSRFGLDCNLFVSLLTISLLITILTIEKKKNVYWILMGISYGITLYTYAVSWIIVPIILLLLLLSFVYFKIGNLKKYILTFITVFILAIPLILFNIINIFDLPSVKLFNTFTIPYMDNYRGNEVVLNSPFKNLCKALLVSLTNDRLNYNCHPVVYTLYRLSIFLVVIGFVYVAFVLINSIKTKKFKYECFALYIFIANCVFAMTNNDIVINRINGIYCSYLLFIIIAINQSCNFTFRLLSKKFTYNKKLIIYLSHIPLAICLIIYSLNFMDFITIYYTDNANYEYFNDRVDETVNRLSLENREGQYYLNVYFLHYLFARGVNPYHVDLKIDKDLEHYKNIHFATPTSNIEECLNKYDGCLLSDDDYRYKDLGYKITEFEDYELYEKKDTN